MGYDKPDLGFVVHVGAPPSPVSYYQQVGRAGRAIEHAHAVLLPSDADAGVWDYFATATIPVPEQVRAVLDVLDRSPEEPVSVVAVEAQSGVRRGRVELMLKQLAVDGVVDRVEGGWLATGTEWSYDAEHYEGVVAVRRREADIMRAYVRGERCLMELLQESLDDPAAEPCGRCSVCRGRSAASAGRCAVPGDGLEGHRAAARAGARPRAAQDVAGRRVRFPGTDPRGGGARRRAHPGVRRRARVAGDDRRPVRPGRPGARRGGRGLCAAAEPVADGVALPARGGGRPLDRAGCR